MAHNIDPDHYLPTIEEITEVNRRLTNYCKDHHVLTTPAEMYHVARERPGSFPRTVIMDMIKDVTGHPATEEHLNLAWVHSPMPPVYNPRTRKVEER